MQYCSRGSKKHCMKNLVQFRLNALGTTLHRSKPYAMLPERLQTTLHKGKSCAMLSQYSLENIAQLKPYAMLPERLQTTLHKENVPFNVNGLCNLGPMPCYSRGSKQHFTGKNSGNSGNVV